MNGELMRIQTIVQEVAEAIASALMLDVEIFDNNLVVVGATGRIRSKIGFKQDTAHVSRHIIEGGSSYLIEKPGEHELCRDCRIKSSCFCTAALVYPITHSGRMIGTISLLSFDEKQRESLISRQGHYLDFTARMGELLAGQVLLSEAHGQIGSNQKYLTTIIDSVSEGIIAVDADAKISYLNKAAERLLNLQSDLIIGKPIRYFFDSSALPSVIQNKTAITAEEMHYQRDNNDHRLIYSAYPIILGEEVVGAVKTITDIKQLKKVAGSIRRNDEQITFDDIKGGSLVMQKLIERARVVAAGGSTILLQGESGTGKELFARAIYQASPYATGPFQVINCSAIPEALLESELFGYEEGAFTGAKKGGKPGKFELADGGTLFLDEIGDMPLFLQAKLLRVLEGNKLERVGGVKERDYDVRIIAATNRDLGNMVSNKQFREDLYYRLNVIPLHIPSMRHRQEDIMVLAEFYLQKYNFLLSKSISHFDEDVKMILLNHPWPGNVRELINVIEYAVNFEHSRTLSKNSLPNWLTQTQSTNQTSPKLKNKTQEWEYETICRMIDEMGNTLAAKKAIAKHLGISLTTLYRKMNKQ